MGKRECLPRICRVARPRFRSQKAILDLKLHRRVEGIHSGRGRGSVLGDHNRFVSTSGGLTKYVKKDVLLCALENKGNWLLHLVCIIVVV